MQMQKILELVCAYYIIIIIRICKIVKSIQLFLIIKIYDIIKKILSSVFFHKILKYIGTNSPSNSTFGATVGLNALLIGRAILGAI